MRERLIELISEVQYMGGLEEKLADHLLANGVVVVDTNKVSAKNIPLITHIAGYPINEVIDLIEARNAGRIIVLPCAMGDTVWFIFGRSCHSAKVAEFAIVPFEEIGYSALCYGGFSFDKRQFGKTVFLTKEEAEKALERSNNEKV